MFVSDETHQAMIQSMSEGLVRLTIDRFTGGRQKIQTDQNASLGYWEQVQLSRVLNTVALGNVSALRLEGEAISHDQLMFWDSVFDIQAKATTIQRYLFYFSCTRLIVRFNRAKRWWKMAIKQARLRARKRLRDTLYFMSTKPHVLCSDRL